MPEPVLVPNFKGLHRSVPLCNPPAVLLPPNATICIDATPYPAASHHMLRGYLIEKLIWSSVLAISRCSRIKTKQNIRNLNLTRQIHGTLLRSCAFKHIAFISSQFPTWKLTKSIVQSRLGISNFMAFKMTIHITRLLATELLYSQQTDSV